MPVTVAPARTEEELIALLPLIADYQRFYGCEPDEARNREFFGSLSADEGLQLMAVDATGHAVGFATLYWVRVSTRAGVVALLNDLYVHPDHRGGRSAGVGTQLLRAAADAAAEAGMPSLVWETAPDNTSAQALYDRFLTEAGAPDRAATWLHYSCPLSAGSKEKK